MKARLYRRIANGAEKRTEKAGSVKMVMQLGMESAGRIPPKKCVLKATCITSAGGVFSVHWAAGPTWACADFVIQILNRTVARLPLFQKEGGDRVFERNSVRDFPPTSDAVAGLQFDAQFRAASPAGID